MESKEEINYQFIDDTFFEQYLSPFLTYIIFHYFYLTVKITYEEDIDDRCNNIIISINNSNIYYSESYQMLVSYLKSSFLNEINLVLKGFPVKFLFVCEDEEKKENKYGE